MLIARTWSRLFLTLVLAAGACLAQKPESPKEPPRFYKLDFVVKELDNGKLLNARSYSITGSTDGSPSQIRTGSKIPVPSSPGSTQFSFIDVGVHIDCRSIKEAGSELSLAVATEISSTVRESIPSSYPIVRQNRWDATVLVPLRKPTVIFSSDDAATTHQIQLELTVTPMT